MKKKGFTLVELLSVIVILAVIAIIAVPIISNILEKSRKSAFKDSVLSAFDSVEYYLLENNLGSIPENGIQVTSLNLKNNNFDSGRFIKNVDGALIAEFISDGKYCASGTLTNLTINKGECEISAPTIEVTVSSKEATITLTDVYGIVGYVITKSMEDTTEWIEVSEVTEMLETVTAESAGTYYVHAKNKYGKVTIKEYTISESAFCSYEIGSVWSYEFTESSEEFVTPCSGTYKLEAWGAGNGTYGGGYTTGEVKLSKDTSLYVYVGGSANTFNGGGTGYTIGSGATDIRVIPATEGSWYDINHTSWEEDESLLSRLITSGGAGGLSYFDDPRGRTSNNRYTGGYSWSNGSKIVANTYAAALSDETLDSTLGQGANGSNYSINYSLTSYEEWKTPGAGGGWYGGYVTNILTKSGYDYVEGNMQGEGTGVTNYHTINIPLGATGGSNHIQTIYDKYTLISTQSFAGNEEMPTQDGSSTMTGNLSNGYAKITLVTLN